MVLACFSYFILLASFFFFFFFLLVKSPKAASTGLTSLSRDHRQRRLRARRLILECEGTRQPGVLLLVGIGVEQGRVPFSTRSNGSRWQFPADPARFATLFPKLLLMLRGRLELPSHAMVCSGLISCSDTECTRPPPPRQAELWLLRRRYCRHNMPADPLLGECEGGLGENRCPQLGPSSPP